MARYTFAGTVYDLTVTDGGVVGDPLERVANQAFPLYATVGGAAVTDFRLWNSATSAYDIAVTSISSDSNGKVPAFQGPDGVSVLYDADGYVLLARETGGGGGAVDSVNGQTGVVVLDAGDVGAETSGTAVLKSLVDAKGDLLVGSAADTVVRKAVGADGTILVADAASAGGVKWEAPAAGVAVHADEHATGGNDELALDVGQINGLGTALAGLEPLLSRFWDPVARTWTARPTTTGNQVVRAYSTNDETASQPPSSVLGDQWYRHPDAPTV